MHLRRLFLTAFPALLLFASAHAFADPGPGLAAVARVAIANPSRIFTEMQETKALRDKLEITRKDLLGQETQLRNDIETLINQRAQTNPNHPNYKALTTQIDEAKAKLQLWGMTTKARVEREQKEMIKTLYDKIEAATAEVAQKNGVDIVIADGRSEITNVDEIPPDELRRSLNSRTILYGNPAFDLTDKVLVLLDARFAQDKK